VLTHAIERPTFNEAVVRDESNDSFFINPIRRPPKRLAWQLNENDNNKNRKCKVMDKRVAETYAKASRATNKNALFCRYFRTGSGWREERRANKLDREIYRGEHGACRTAKTHRDLPNSFCSMSSTLRTMKFTVETGV
jgi:hypothetical protein